MTPAACSTAPGGPKGQVHLMVSRPPASNESGWNPEDGPPPSPPNPQDGPPPEGETVQDDMMDVYFHKEVSQPIMDPKQCCICTQCVVETTTAPHVGQQNDVAARADVSGLAVSTAAQW